MPIEDRLRSGLTGEASSAGVEQAMQRVFQQRRTSLRRRWVAAAVGACAVTALGPWAVQLLDSSDPDAAHPSGVVNEDSPPPVSSAIDGQWVSHLTRRQMVEHIKDAGLGEWVEDFLDHEKPTPRYTAVYTFDSDTFEVAYLEQGGGWHVGWKGSLTHLPDQRIRMHDDFSGVTDTYRWRMDDDRLDLDRVKAAKALVNDIPYQVYDAAYMNDWWLRTTCPMTTGEDC